MVARLARDLHDTPHLLSVFGVWIDDRPVHAAWIAYGAHSQFAGL